MGSLDFQPLDGGDFRALDGGYRQHAGPGGHASDVHGTGAALGNAAAVLGALEVEDVPQHPQEGHVRGDVHGGGFPIDGKGDGHGDVCLRVDTRNRQNLIVRSLLPNPQAGGGKRWYP